ncbi:hypothetical protein [Bradyrhizobium sp. LTSPM299]|uniref:hypothetical protein n=1 Tax=Bradyrhizobium sp. LTSPM299 TaxID=1619233 RepID=UPI000B2EE4BE|nr:hypothetical protein [Bradyrhizobium sp. LTSPM299]
MKKIWEPSFLLGIFLFAGAALGQDHAQRDAGTASRTFTPLHVYYISPTGSDLKDGLTPATAWATPKHNVVCGDVLIAADGNYDQGQFGHASYGSDRGNFGAVSNCPSTTGGIDGTGGIYFAILMCAGPDLMSCRVNGGSGPAFDIGRGNWAVEGFWATQKADAERACYGSLGTVTGTTWHHVAFINNIASGCDLAGFDTGNIGIPNAGPDQTAFVGGIVFNGARSLGRYRRCGSAISLIPAGATDDSPGTHVYVSQNFLYRSINATDPNQCTVTGDANHPHSDGNGIIFDTWAGNSYPYQAVVANNVIWGNGNACFQAFPGGGAGWIDRAPINVLNNTCYNNNQDSRAHCAGELYLHGVYPTATGIYSVSNNIFLGTLTSCGGGGYGPIVSAWVENAGKQPLSNSNVSISGNYIWNNHPPTTSSAGGKNTVVYNGRSNGSDHWVFGANTFDNPGLTNPSELPTEAPDCAGYANTVSCMNAKYSVYNLVKPTIAPMSVGYQPPGSCTPDPYYPMWLKGIVYLHWDGARLFETDGLATKPCRL